MSPEAIDWASLERLRAVFLEARTTSDYWQSETDLVSYDATFAQRIGWKWDFVLGDLRQRPWRPPRGEVVDWACGSGIAARAFLDHFGAETVTSVRFVDRSLLAMRFAAARAATRFPGLPIACGPASSLASATVLLSHVLTELTSPQLEHLLAHLEPAAAILWVEPGTHQASRALLAVRERLRPTFHPVAPCVHAQPCGLLVPGNEPHWCHQFASPPAEVFADPFWGRFARLLGIDLRSVPLSYLVLDRRPPVALPAGTVRVLGRARLNKADLRVFACDATGVTERSLTRREFPDVWRDARKGRTSSLQSWPIQT
jgi:hypothetical protein